MTEEVKKELNTILKKYYLTDVSQVGLNLWQRISYEEKLSENFIREFHDNLDWVCMSEYQMLSEKIIRKVYKRIS